MSLQWIPDNPVTPVSPAIVDTATRAARDQAVTAAGTATTKAGEASESAEAAATAALIATAAGGWTVHADDYSLVIADAGRTIGMAKETALTLTVPAEADVAFAAGTRIDVVQADDGALAIAGADGVTIRSADDALTLRARWAAASLLKIAADEWLLVGDLEA